ncbi:helix-turn-helix transcriptional regulator [Shimia sp. MIT910701]|uniref:helix-turn-helix transcriptional regulator n=1 Tax=Shimia sp. MIT910701 TaxID=3096987 RepID=UPI00399AF68C
MDIDHTLISEIYRSASLEPAFVPALARFARRYEAAGSSILINDVVEPVVSQIHFSPIEIAEKVAEFMRLFGQDEQKVVRKVGAMNERFQFMSEADAHDLGDDISAGTAWSREHMGLDKRYAARLSVTPLWFDSITLNYAVNHPGISEKAKVDAPVYMQHFAAALDMMRPFRLLQARFRAVSAALDRMTLGVAVVARNGTVVHHNRRFGDLVDQRDGVALDASGQLRFSGAARPQGGRLMAQLQSFAADDRRGADRAHYVFERPSGRMAYVASLCPLAELMDDDPSTAEMAVLVIKDVSLGDPIEVDGLASIFALTEAEAEVSRLLVNGASVKEIAAQRDVSVGSTRNQISSVLEKTASKSQTHLIRTAMKVDLPVEPVPDLPDEEV